MEQFVFSKCIYLVLMFSERGTMGDFRNEDFISERLSLCFDKIESIKGENICNEALDLYFHKVTDFILIVKNIFDKSNDGSIKKENVSILKKYMEDVYSDILPENYDKSYANPTFARENLGEFGDILSLLYYEIRSIIPFAYEVNKWQILVRLELFVEIYTDFCNCLTDAGKLPSYENIRKILYFFYRDYEEDMRLERFQKTFTLADDFAKNIIENADLSDTSYLYLFGEYISDNELNTAKFLNTLSKEQIDALAKTYTEGYRMGFEATNKDITKKKTVAIRYNLGFERVVKKAMENFKEIGLDSILYRNGSGLFYGANSMVKTGFYGASANKQYEYDHKDDNGLILDKALFTRKVESLKNAGEKCKVEARLFGGPAVIEVFGEKPFEPENNKDAIKLSKEQQSELSKYRIEASVITNEYIPGDERSFTIIAFPISEIGDKYEEIFAETVKINTLDYMFYRDLQQKIIDTLDSAKYVEVKGMNGNKTNIRIMLHELKDKEHETNFENCVADVNIPVGEVFTSPVLKDTNGILNVSGVYLNEFYFKNLTIELENGCVKNYSCDNFENADENKKYIDDNILYHHKTLPIGEFAIGTNTIAYVMARKYGIQDKMPILIDEKTGPHFALGDTCYSHEEDVMTYNPDGKKIIARSNEISDLRNEDMSKAYFGCHTDITLPYDELGSLEAVREDGSKIMIIEKGRFVLPGTESLNKPLDEAGF